MPPHLTTQLQLLDKKLAELKDWKSFSVAPKRVELMEEMESLVGATLEPPVLAERIKGLQEEWRTLSKGAGENLEADWQRFQEAAQKAYQPCREYFEAQALVRQENLQRRAALLQRLAAFESGHDWEQPDWRTVAVALRESKQEWRGHRPVDRAPAKPCRSNFDALTASLQARLDAEYARNIKRDDRWSSARSGSSRGEDSRKAIDEVKALQQQWKEVGLVPRDEGSAAVGGVSAALRCRVSKAAAGVRRVQRGAGGQQGQGRFRLCEELEKIAALSGAELLEGAAADSGSACRIRRRGRVAEEPMRAACTRDSSARWSVVKSCRPTGSEQCGAELDRSARCGEPG